MKKQLKGYIIIITGLLLLLFFVNRIEQKGAPEHEYRDTSHLIFTKHAKCRMDCRHIDRSEVKEVIEKGKLNNQKSGRSRKNDQTYALEGWTADNQHVRIIVTPEKNGLLVITVIDLGNDWACNCD